MDSAALRAMATSTLYAGLTQAECAELSVGMERRSFAAGQPLMVQGEASDGAHLILSGSVDVTSRLPGGGEAAIARLGAGDAVGEMGLLARDGRRTATARADGPVQTLFTDRRMFEASLHMLRPASLSLLRALAVSVARRLRDIRRHSLDLIEGDAAGVWLREAPAGVATASPEAPFDLRPFLAILPGLRDFAPEDLDRLFALATVRPVRRGDSLSDAGGGATQAFIVVRGAVMLAHRRGSRLHQLDVLGPGRFAGVAPVIEGSASAAGLLAAEDSTLLAFDAAAFLSLWSGGDRLALRLVEAVAVDLVRTLETADNHLARLTTQARAVRLAG